MACGVISLVPTHATTTEQPWEVVAWSPEQERTIYREWGEYFSRLQLLDEAKSYYDKCLKIRADDPLTLYYRSICKRNIAQAKEALDDALAASELGDFNAFVSLAHSSALYEMNKFENCAMELHDNSYKYKGAKVSAFKDGIIVVNGNLMDSLGDKLGPFLMKNEKVIKLVMEKMRKDGVPDDRPLWKILKEAGECDVLSILEKKELVLSPRELARRQRAFNVFHQFYLNKSWIDVGFMKKLKSSPNLLRPQFLVTTPQLNNIIKNKYVVVQKFLKMLHSRSPLYSELSDKFPDWKLFTKHRDAILFRVQYQTRRNMIMALRKIRKLRAEGQVEKLARFVESFVGDYVVLKTPRTMCWKFEFLNEVYNTLALAFVDRYLFIQRKLLENGCTKPGLHRLLGLTKESKDRPKTFVFGDKSTYQEPDAIDYSALAYKRFLARLERRMRFAKYPIERCYIFHEIARAHLRQSRHDECCSVSRKAIEEGKRCNSYIWAFLAAMLIVKSHTIMLKIERCHDALEEANTLAEYLKSAELMSFLDLARIYNDDEIAIKKRVQSEESMRRIRSKMSLGSRRSSHRSSGTDKTDDDDDDSKITSFKILSNPTASKMNLGRERSKFGPKLR